MKLLPEVTIPPRTPHPRRHEPASGEAKKHWVTYHPCLRWEFGFSCAFCLLHESDLTPDGADGWALMTTEHFIPQSTNRSRANDYDNCYLCCRRCNQSRHKRPIEHPDGCLLDPCQVAWADHFRIDEDFAFDPREDDRDAARTLIAYDLNDEGKIRRRRSRGKALAEAWELYQRALSLGERLNDRFDRDAPDYPDLLTVVRLALEQAWRTLSRWAAVPADAQWCGCEPIPRWLLEQARDLLEPSFPAAEPMADT